MLDRLEGFSQQSSIHGVLGRLAPPSPSHTPLQHPRGPHLPHTMAADSCVCFPHRSLPSSPAPHAGGPRKPSPGPREPLGGHGLLARCSPGPPCTRTRRVISKAWALFVFLIRDPADLLRTGRAENPGLAPLPDLQLLGGNKAKDPVAPVWSLSSYVSHCK